MGRTAAGDVRHGCGGTGSLAAVRWVARHQAWLLGMGDTAAGEGETAEVGGRHCFGQYCCVGWVADCGRWAVRLRGIGCTAAVR